MQEAYAKVKELFTSKALLVHYDAELKLKLVCDASNYGIGAVISHVMDDYEEKSVASASRTFTKSERNYVPLI